METFEPGSYKEPDTQQELLNNISALINWDATVDFLGKRFVHYRLLRNRLHRLRPCTRATIPHPDYLDQLWASRAKVIKDMKRDLRSARSMCPYCGAPVEPNQIDHYLPQAAYPEYVVHPKNLVPCCGGCNTRKSDRGYNIANRMFLNPFSDKFLGTAFYYYKITPDPVKSFNVPLFEAQFAGWLTDDERAVCREHFKALEIEQRSAKPLRQMIKRLRIEFRPEVQRGVLTPAVLQRHLAREYRAAISMKEFNSLRAVFIRSLNRNPALQNFICTQPI